MLAPVLLIIGIFVAVAPQIMAVKAYRAVRPYRTDIPETVPASSGSSWLWQLNVMRASNYSKDGRVLLKTLWLWVGLSQLGVLIDVLLLAWRFP